LVGVGGLRPNFLVGGPKSPKGLGVGFEPPPPPPPAQLSPGGGGGGGELPRGFSGISATTPETG